MSKAFLAQSGNGAGFSSMPFNLLAEGTRHGYGPMANPYGRDGHCGPQQRSEFPLLILMHFLPSVF